MTRRFAYGRARTAHGIFRGLHAVCSPVGGGGGGQRTSVKRADRKPAAAADWGWGGERAGEREAADAVTVIFHRTVKLVAH